MLQLGSGSKNRSNKKREVGIAEAIRDVFIVAINKGQLPVLGVISVILLILFRVPETEIVSLIREIINSLGKFTIVSYSLNVVLLGGWVWHAKSVRQMHSRECDRVGREKTKLQLEQLKNHEED